MHDDPDDVAAVIAGDRARFGRLVDRHQGPVRAVVRSWVGSGPVVDDLAQDVFLRAWRALRSWRASRGTFRTWLLAIARNRARDHLRRRAVRPIESELEREPIASARSAQAGAAAFDGAFRAVLDHALAELSPERRVVFLLADVHGLPLAEVAALEKVALGTVKSRLDRARRALRGALERRAARTEES